MSDGFGLSNLPYGSIRRDASSEPRLCVRLHDDAVELAALSGDLGVERELVAAPNLDRLLTARPDSWHAPAPGPSAVPRRGRPGGGDDSS
jgi:hypothetical protein